MQNQPKIRRRKPWAAALLSLIAPGLGQLYAGDLRRGLVLFAIPALGLVLAFAIGLASAPSGIVRTMLLLGIPLCLLRYVLIPWDAARAAKRNGDFYVLKFFNHWAIYGALMGVGTVFYSGLVSTLRQRWLEPYVFPTASMSPTSVPGDRFYADKRVGHILSTLRRGDLILFQSPKDETLYMKRLIGLAGDKISFPSGRLQVNGTTLPVRAGTPPALGEDGPPADTDYFKETLDGREYFVTYVKVSPSKDESYVVPEGHVFVLGDNRDNSFDSRHFGSVKLSDIRGKPLQVWFSATLAPWRVRWERVGLVLE